MDQQLLDYLLLWRFDDLGHEDIDNDEAGNEDEAEKIEKPFRIHIDDFSGCNAPILHAHDLQIECHTVHKTFNFFIKWLLIDENRVSDNEHSKYVTYCE